MNVTIKTFQSGCGDCIFLILKDKGTQETYLPPVSIENAPRRERFFV